VRLVSRLAGAVTILSGVTQPQLREVTGIGSALSGVILVEDRSAREFAKLIVTRFAPAILDDFEIREVGPGPLRQALTFPEVGSWLAIVGLFDGDMRTQVPATRWPVVFLPGSVGPEGVLRNADSRTVEELSRASGRSVADIRFALGELQGRDDHDWFEDLARALGMPLDALMRALFEVWRETDLHEESARTCGQELLAATAAARKRPLA
jgi:hypothetical protein